MTKWIEWRGGECPIKSDLTWVEYKCRHGYVERARGVDVRWRNNPEFGVYNYVIAYRIIEDNEPVTREQITAQIEALQKQLDAMPVVRRMWFDGSVAWSQKNTPSNATHYFDIETINGVPHIHGVAMKEVGK